jgi:hypothetical protein
MVKRVVAPWLVLRVARRLSRTIPLAGAVLAAAVAGQSVRRKGWVRGVLHAGLDAIPVVGALKGAIEVFTGDWIPDRTRETDEAPARARGSWNAADARPAPTVDDATLTEPPRFLRRVRARGRAWVPASASSGARAR